MASSNKVQKLSIKVFSHQVVSQIEELCPATDEQKNRKKLSQKGIQKALKLFYTEIHNYVVEEKFGVIKRALLARSIQSEMENRTYERSLINQVMMAIILNSLTKKG